MRCNKLFFLVFLLAVVRTAYAEAWNFAVVGDTRGSSASPGVNTDALNATAADIVNNRDCVFILIPGDLVYGGDLDNQFQTFINTTSAAGLKIGGSSGSGLAYYPVRGNHDDNGAVSSWQNKFTTLPQNGPSGEEGLTYSFTYENALILAIDEYTSTSHTVDSQDWIDTQLAGTSAQHVFTIGHDPAYRAYHSDCLADNVSNRDTFLTSLYNASGRLYFCGHDHFTALSRVYEKNFSSGGTQGFYQLIMGGGGAPKHTFNGAYNSGAHSGDYSVADLYHDSDTTNSIPFHYAYALVTVDDDLLWLRIYGTESLTTIDWQFLYALVVSGTLETNTTVFTSNATNDAGITFDQSFDGTYSGVISGMGNLTKSGTCTLTLSGNNTYNGTTTVNAGILSLTGNSSSTPVTVNSGAILQGTGTIKSLVNYGTVKPGNSVGTLNLNGGAFTQGAAGTLEIEVESTSSYDKIIGASSASLDGTLQTVTTGNYTAGDTLSGVIQTSGGITGTFASLDTQITTTMLWEPQVNGNNLDLVATRDYNNDILRASLTSNQQNVAVMLQTELPLATGDLASVKSAINSLDTYAEVAEAYSQISPEKFGGIPSVAFSNAVMQSSNLADHMSALHSGENRGFAFNRRTGAFRGDLFNGLLLAYNGDNLGRLVSRDKNQSQGESGPGFFINGVGNFGDQESTDSQPGFQYTVGGITVGLDYSFTQNLLGGFNLGYTHTSSYLGGSGGKVNVDSISCGIHGIYYRDNLYFQGASSITSNLYDTEREIEFGGLDRLTKSDTSGGQFNLFIGTGYDFHVDQLTTGPTVTLQYSKLWIDSFTESGADSLNLCIADQRAESFQLGLGWRAESKLKVGKKTVVPQLHVSYQHEFANDGRSIEARLESGGDTFQVTTDKPTRDFALVGTGITIGLTESVSVDAGYDAQVGQSDYVTQSVYGSMRFSF